MKNTTKQATRQPTGKATKTIKNRITAFLLALLLVTTVLSPQTPVKAQDTATEYADTTESDSDRDGGGHNVPTRGKLVATQTKIIDSDSFSTEHRYLISTDDYILIELIQPAPESSSLGRRMLCVVFKNPSSSGFSLGIETIYHQNDSTITSTAEYKFSELSGMRHVNGSDVYYVFGIVNFLHGYQESSDSTTYYTASIVSDYHCYIDTKYSSFSSDLYSYVWDLFINNNLTVTPPTDEEIADMTPVRDDSIGYLPRARYFDNRKSASSSHNITATIQWDSFQEPYASDLDNPYYIEIYAKCYYEKLGETTAYRIYKYKKYGDVKYIFERCSFPDDEPCINFLSSLNIELSDLVYGISFPHLYNYGISEYYVRLVHFDDEKQQLLCGGFTKLTLDGKGGCTSSEGDFDDDGNWNDDPDGSGDKSWDDGGDVKPIVPDPGNPDFTIDDTNVFTLLYSLVKSASNFISGTITLFLNAFKTILSSVGEFPALFKSLFSFLPDEITYLMVAGVAAVIVMRFLGR